jgi:hypothetical protein
MADRANASMDRVFIPAPAALLAFLSLGFLAVVTLPNIADDLPHPGRVEQAQYAITCLGLIVLTGAYVYTVTRAQPKLDRAWMLWTLLYGAGLLIVKFILSPTAFQKSADTSLGEFVTSGLVVVPLYVAAFGYLYLLARRRSENWSLRARLGVAATLAIVAVATRIVIALIVGTAPEYMEDLIGPGLVLPAVVAAASLALMQSFVLAGRHLKSALGVGLTLVIGHHLLWTVYMYQLF